jgi:hypothetical protein
MRADGSLRSVTVPEIHHKPITGRLYCGVEAVREEGRLRSKREPHRAKRVTLHADQPWAICQLCRGEGWGGVGHVRQQPVNDAAISSSQGPYRLDGVALVIGPAVDHDMSTGGQQPKEQRTDCAPRVPGRHRTRSSQQRQTRDSAGANDRRASGGPNCCVVRCGAH